MSDALRQGMATDRDDDLPPLPPALSGDAHAGGSASTSVPLSAPTSVSAPGTRSEDAAPADRHREAGIQTRQTTLPPPIHTATPGGSGSRPSSTFVPLPAPIPPPRTDGALAEYDAAHRADPTSPTTSPTRRPPNARRQPSSTATVVQSPTAARNPHTYGPAPLPAPPPPVHVIAAGLDLSDSEGNTDIIKSPGEPGFGLEGRYPASTTRRPATARTHSGVSLVAGQGPGRSPPRERRTLLDDPVIMPVSFSLLGVWVVLSRC